MAENLIPKIAQMLGLEIGEEFKIKGYSETFMLADDKGLMATDDDPKTVWAPANALFIALLNGKEEIIKLPWKPQLDKPYWTFTLVPGIDELLVNNGVWKNSVEEVALLKAGWIYRTLEDAQNAQPKVEEEFIAKYGL